jgi:hypothetical protein
MTIRQDVLARDPFNASDEDFDNAVILANAAGRKDDHAKPRMDLIAPEAMVALARVLTFGAEKYAPRNWEKGMDWGRVYAAAQRHMWAWLAGEDNDPETGLSHMAHAMCCLMFLIAYQARGTGRDDRPRIGAEVSASTVPSAIIGAVGEP